MQSLLQKLHRIASKLEQANRNEEASVVSNVFERLATIDPSEFKLTEDVGEYTPNASEGYDLKELTRQYNMGGDDPLDENKKNIPINFSPESRGKSFDPLESSIQVIQSIKTIIPILEKYDFRKIQEHAQALYMLVTELVEMQKHREPIPKDIRQLIRPTMYPILENLAVLAENAMSDDRDDIMRVHQIVQRSIDELSSSNFGGYNN